VLEVLAWVLVLSAVVFAVSGVPYLLARRALRRRNRVSRVGPPAPAYWLVSPEQAPRLHRRLVRLCQVMGPSRRQRAGPGLLLEAEAVAIDRELIVVAATRGPRRAAALQALEARIDRLEEISLKAHRFDEPMTLELRHSADPLRELEVRLELREAAWDEVHRAEHPSS